MKKPVVKQRLLHRIMKITLFQFVLALVFSSFAVANNVNGQKKLDTKVTIIVENLTLDNALSKIEKSAHVKFSYNSRLPQLSRKVSIEANQETLSSILSRILVPFNITFSEVSNQIILQKTAADPFASADNHDSLFEVLTAGPIIKGKVTDQTGSPLPGATVMAKGTKVAVLTDFDGNFSIEMPANADKLVISYVGMETKEIGITNVTPTVVLTEAGQNLKEVVVTTGYEKTSKRTFTGAISKISGSELKVEGVVDVSRMIEGKAAGVTVQNVTGTFGTAPKITVRGSSSIFGDTKPLWVIDGVVQEDIINVTFADLASGNSATLLSSSVAGLNSNDIQSIEVLKDASATSIYGSRSLNGVVVVTTKQGRRDSPLKVSYSVENTVRTVPSYSQYDILNSQESMSVFQEMRQKGYLDLSSSYTGRFGGVYNILAREINNYNTSNGQYGVKNDQPYINEFLKKYELVNTDWFSVLFRPSITQNHSLSFSGGGKNNTFYASLGYYTDPGWTIADNVKQLSSNLKGTFFINDKLNITLSTLGSIRNQQAPGAYESKQDVVFGKTTRDFDINPFNYVLSTSRTLRPYDDKGNLEYYQNNWAPMNIVNELANNTLDIKVNDIRFQVDLDYKINKNLTYNLTGSARYANTSREHRIYEGSNVVGAYNAGVGNNVNSQIQKDNVFLYQNPNDLTAPKVSVLPSGGFLRKFTNDMTSYNIRNSVTYRNIFKDKHEVEGFFGTELRSVDRNNDNFTAVGIQYNKGLTPFIDPRIIEKIVNGGDSYYDFGEERERTVGFFGKVGYTYDRRYTASLTGRYDGSNRQGDTGSSRWLPTYTVSGKWNVAEESFMKNNETINTLALRASYGLTATAGPATNSLAIYKSFITDRFNLSDRENAIRIEDLQNKDLTWEKQYETNIGVDLGMFNNRVSLAADVYRRKAFDLIDYVITSGVGGESIKQGNNADMETKGIELGLTTQNIVTDNFKWSTTLNFSVFNQEITKLANRPSAFDLVDSNGGNTVGHPRNSIYSYQFTGLNNQGLPTFNLQEGAENNITGADFQDTKDVTKYLKYEGSIEPNKSIGLANTFTYKNWSLYVFVVGSGGNKVRLNPVYSNKYTDLTVFTKEYANRWINPGDENVTNVPVIADRLLNRNYGERDLEIAYNTYNFSDVRIADGDFVRLKNVTLSWEFPKDYKKKLGLSTFTLKGSAVNPWLIYSDKRLHGQDPEFRNTGGVAFPITSQYTFTLNVSF
ncbi:SusC/RagA family TonB-linked outer membrane protein [Flavobacterium johnsoniae]|jgi:TonB-linked SusC/RagA family outer membrane protein|uniref:SusC-like TonB-dependent receptor n=1 Tax=Flavobacterium johnsoniae (strain ATCC 17061 / DSM 2064 / JCM 8514 / BCRC 14874 / CCUG 350202 / NBRC 14942 / NCIMB 11054 / UW101) TaxID=376686 RepID=A5FFV0_FLAJ1|nr:SusC/RagA family TonB-linked outer membrane protein [Flavobacterium johnsoniae]ABQ05915.1 SusC-like TonB-dependent receptor [Flavobacterium johnsoniae UW101]OXE95518.1 SusC/RagA family TonB-linked outer membrane protein [Flavobacterium johnsoniae UW101]WQG81652.1 SusC/RagA family TonB-linked outer membrane protein [Flavobacterium johnsoniae UW101]SHK59894.1 TonB-linked outer membrane protein, SusC/RagA family [Flavobacterium johnsoniae]